MIRRCNTTREDKWGRNALETADHDGSATPVIALALLDLKAPHPRPLDNAQSLRNDTPESAHQTIAACILRAAHIPDFSPSFGIRRTGNTHRLRTMIPNLARDLVGAPAGDPGRRRCVLQ